MTTIVDPQDRFDLAYGRLMRATSAEHATKVALRTALSNLQTCFTNNYKFERTAQEYERLGRAYNAWLADHERLEQAQADTEAAGEALQTMRTAQAELAANELDGQEIE